MVLLIQLTVVLAAAVGVREVAFTTYRIPSESMEHPLEVGNRIGVEKVSQWWRRPARGDVIVFWPEGEGDPWVKRVVAVGGGA